METTGRTSRSTAVAAGVALVLSGCGAVSLAVGDAIGFVTPGTEAVFTIAVIIGWMLLAWAAVIAGVAAVLLVRAAGRRGRPFLLDTLLVVATVAVVAGVMSTYPVAGSGAGAEVATTRR